MPDSDKKPLKFVLPNPVEFLLHLPYKRTYIAGPEPIDELSYILMNNLHAFGDVLFTGLAILLGHLGEFVNAVQVDVFYFIYGRLEVSRHGYINEQQSSLPSAFHYLFERALAEEIILSRR